MKKKITAMLMICATLCGLALSGCGESTDGVDTTTAQTDIGTDTTALTEEASLAPEVVNYDGYSFRIHSNANNDNSKIDVDEVNGDLMNDAIYERNRRIEADYNITIELTHDKDLSKKLPNYIQANEDFADIAFLAINKVFPFAQEGYLYDWNTVDSIMLDADWWEKRALEQLPINDKLFTLYGEISTADEISMVTLHYNKKMYNDNGFEDAYEIVNSGAWTFDRFWQYVTAVTQDLDGDGKITPNDCIGMITEYSAFNEFYAGAGHKTIIMNGDSYVLNTSNEKAYDIVNKISVIATEKNKNTLICDDGTVEGSYETGEKMFHEGRGLFQSSQLRTAVMMRDVEGEYGVLPIPKYDESQDGYYDLVSWNAPTVILPTTATDISRSGVITDAMGYRSMVDVRDIFYNVFLDEKVVRDEESKGMLDIIFASKSYDLDFFADVSGFTSLLNNIALSGQNNFASEYAKIEESAQAKLDDFISKFDD